MFLRKIRFSSFMAITFLVLSAMMFIFASPALAADGTTGIYEIIALILIPITAIVIAFAGHYWAKFKDKIKELKAIVEAIQYALDGDKISADELRIIVTLVQKFIKEW